MLNFNMNRRQNDLSKKLQHVGKILFEEEAKRFGVSSMTIRRDLSVLEEAGLAIRIPGGARSYTKTNLEQMLEDKSSNTQKRIAAKALEFIEPNSTIMLSAGTTTLEIARQLAASGMPLSLVTNSLQVAFVLFQSPVQVLLTGGSLRTSSLDLVGPVTEKNLNEFYIDILFMGCDGAASNEGFFTSDLNLASMEHKSVEVSEKAILVTESSKFAKPSFMKYASLEDVSTVITDRNINPDDEKNLIQHDIQVITV